MKWQRTVIASFYAYFPLSKLDGHTSPIQMYNEIQATLNRHHKMSHSVHISPITSFTMFTCLAFCLLLAPARHFVTITQFRNIIRSVYWTLGIKCVDKQRNGVHPFSGPVSNHVRSNCTVVLFFLRWELCTSKYNCFIFWAGELHCSFYRCVIASTRTWTFSTRFVAIVFAGPHEHAKTIPRHWSSPTEHACSLAFFGMFSTRKIRTVGIFLGVPRTEKTLSRLSNTQSLESRFKIFVFGNRKLRIIVDERSKCKKEISVLENIWIRMDWVFIF